jgi:hypothetical protein
LSGAFAVNSAVLTAAALVLAVSPATVSFPIAIAEAVVLGAWLVAALGVNPRLAATCREISGRRERAASSGDRTAELLGITWACAIGSGLVDNIPFTAAMVPVVEQLQAGSDDDAYWWALALGACFGGNATLVAAAANVAAAGMASRAGRPIGFVTFLRIGLRSHSSRSYLRPPTSP